MNAPKPTVVITDWTFPDLGVEEGIFHAHGLELVARQCRTDAELIALCANADAVITQFARVNANVVAAMKQARAIVPAAQFARRMEALFDEIHAAPRAEGVSRLYVPGEMEWERRDRALTHGIPLPEDVVINLRKAAEMTGLAPEWLQ